jgi:TMEM175 potassium channel family protein
MEGEHDVISGRRLEAFSDSVMAVIITLMAFELRPPAGQSWHQIDHRLPNLLVYILSFTAVAIYWNNHHHLLRVAASISGAVMWANLALLFWLSLVPFATQWVANAYRSTAPAVAYGLVAMGSAIAYFVLVRALVRANHHDPVLIGALGTDRKGAVSVVIYLLGIGLAFATPYLMYACAAAVSAMWIIPDRRLTGRPTPAPSGEAS